jgi:hypothetical protein
MQAPDPQTNLSEKFAALREQMTAQHDALVLKIDALRGEGPENTLKSINQSLWNIAGPAPGKSLTDLYNAFMQMVSQWDSGAGITPYNLLDGIYTNLVALGTTEDAAKAILVRLIAQFDTSVVYPTMKDILLTISQQQAQIATNTAGPFAGPPAGACAAPFVSAGFGYIPVNASLVTSATLATWPTTVPDGFDLTTESGGIAVGQSKVKSSDWTQFKVYVASNATEFGVSFVNLQKFKTNKWIILSGNGFFEFFTLNDEALTVYICPVNAPALGACPGASDPLTITSWWHSAYDEPRPPNVSWLANAWTGGATWSEPGQLPFAGGETFHGFYVTRPVTSVGICISWDVSNEPTCTGIGIQAFQNNLSEIANIYQDIEIDINGSVGSMSAELNLSGYENSVNNILLIPFVSFSDNHTLPPNVAISISWIEMHLS